MKKQFSLLLLALCFVLGACNSTPESKPLAKHVVLVGVDGFGAYAYHKADMPNLKKLASEGSWGVKTRSVLPSSSAVNWASILMSSTPTQHGYTEWGSQTPEIPSSVLSQYGKYPSIFTLIREQQPESKTAVIYSWGGIIHLLEEQTIDWKIGTEDSDDVAVEKATEIIINEKPLFTFIHLSEPDIAGHGVGHDSQGYYDELKRVDQRIGLIAKAIDDAGIAEETILMIVADHGGINYNHGGKDLMEVETPMVIKGPGIKANHEVTDQVLGFDYGITIARMLNIEPHKAWRGKVIEDIFIE